MPFHEKSACGFGDLASELYRRTFMPDRPFFSADVVPLPANGLSAVEVALGG
jgi:hypothetical protein